ncbi:hypothetical protein QNI19_33710 [Cytophagaceae bacterium DM2B3-1]|uniref:DUF1249 domain-containing protein n=1 Tax=Xanthocytophaga flava TaxID=3048013 RepID=A0ABT7CYG3_9BACT|nr:hypothetical protein [Xanthocytophaga flavus]MDJ1472597.1 hypothetical protein [Xanthocytophaga flavus]MDJ1497947.1 hypothetical protein [Xanthocytophaga flavus]
MSYSDPLSQSHDEYHNSYRSAYHLFLKMPEQYVTAYNRFLRWLQAHPDGDRVRMVESMRGVDRRYSNMLYDFFVYRGIVVNITGVLQNKQVTYSYHLAQDRNRNYQISSESVDELSGEGFHTRLDAEAAAFQHAFALLEQWIADQAHFGINM